MERVKGRYEALCLILILIFEFLVGGLLLMCCSSPKEIVKTEYKTRLDTLHRTDSVHVTDSVYVLQKGDTLIKERWRIIFKDREVYRSKVDTFIKKDTILSVKLVEKELSKLDRTRMQIGDASVIILIIFLIYIIYKVRT